MPSGEQRGFTYLGVLIVVGLLGATLAGLGERTTLAVQRERERELLFRGQQIRHAIERYRDASPERELPHALDDLLADRRSGQPVHHLRRRYTDPFTGRADWVLLRGPDQGLLGVRSRAQTRRVLQPADPPASGPHVSDWAFQVAAEAPAPGAGPPNGSLE